MLSSANKNHPSLLSWINIIAAAEVVEAVIGENLSGKDLREEKLRKRQIGLTEMILRMMYGKLSR